MYQYRPDTLAAYRQRSLFVARSYADHSMRSMVDQMKAYKPAVQHVRPETEALKFYLLNHTFALMKKRFHPHESMGKANELAQLYTTQAAVILERALYYITMITIREARHLHDPEVMAKRLTTESGVLTVKQAKAYEKLRSNMNDTHDWNVVLGLSDEYCPGITVGQYFKAISMTHHLGKFGGSWGGKKWGNVTDCALKMVLGQTSPEIMLDTVWALVHNGGPIFNKGMLYQTYDKYSLTKILDVQRAGQIPQLIASTPVLKVTGLDYSVKEMFEQCCAHFPELEGSVDWYAVEAAGAVQSYPQEKKDQKNVNVHVEKKKVEPKKIETKKIEPVVDTIELADKFYIGVDQYATTYVRKKSVKAAA